MFWKKKKKPQYRGRRDQKISRLLANNKGCALTVERISEAINMNENTVRSMLRNLLQSLTFN